MPKGFRNRDQSRVPPVIVVDGTESGEGRALCAISSFYWCTDWLPQVDLRLSDVTDENVVLAAQAFESDCGIPVTIQHRSLTVDPLSGADLYAAIAHQSTAHLRVRQAAKAGIPVFVAIQFPSLEECRPQVFLRQRAAFDPHVFADELHAVVRPWL